MIDKIKIPEDKLIGMYTTMVRIRQFEDRVYLLFLQGEMPGTIHLSQGQEAVAAGVCANLRREDLITSTHRPIPVATGLALACKMMRLDRVVVSFFGDGASNTGAFHEAVNMGAIWNLPVVYVCENNLYGASTHVSKVMKIKDIAERASSYGIPGKVVDGNNIFSVYEAAREAI